MMLMSGDYALTYEKKRNYINIFLPQTQSTLESTARPLSDRRTDVAESDLMVLLQVAMIIFEEGENNGKRMGN